MGKNNSFMSCLSRQIKQTVNSQLELLVRTAQLQLTITLIECRHLINQNYTYYLQLMTIQMMKD